MAQERATEERPRQRSHSPDGEAVVQPSGFNVADLDSANPLELAESLTIQIRRERDLEYVSLLLVDEPKQRLIHLAHAADYDVPVVPGHVHPMTRGLIGKCARERRTTYVDDVGVDRDYYPLVNGVHSELVVPICSNDEVIGVLNCESRDGGLEGHIGYFEDTAKKVERIVAGARRIWLRDELLIRAEQEAERLSVLNEIARIANRDLELEPMLQRITDILHTKFRWEFVALSAVDHETNRFVCQAISASHPTIVQIGYGRALGDGVVGQVAATGESIVADDVRMLTNYREAMADVLSEMCVPVKHANRVVAVLDVESTHLGAFRELLPLAETIAEQVAGAIANARLYAELKERTRQLEILNDKLQLANDALHRLSTHDGLTGIANRRYFDERLTNEWRRAARTQQPLALVMIDIDYFKAFNDAYGHLDGDDCLKQVAYVLSDHVQRAGDLIARFGGEEFVVILPGLDAEAASRVGEAFRRKVEALGIIHQESQVSPSVTISVGVASTIPPGDPTLDASHLIAAADHALYIAKREGRNRVVVAGR